MAKRKRASGGGMKPGVNFQRLSSPLSIRMPDAMRAELKLVRGRNGASAKNCSTLTKIV